MQIDRPITIAIIIFIIILLIFFLVVPEFKTYRFLQQDLGEKIAEFNAEHDYFAEIDKIYFELQSRKEDIKKIDDSLPQESSMGKIIYFVQKTAKENGMIIKDLFLSKSSPSNTASKLSDSVKDIVFSTNVLGTYKSLGNFLKSLEKSARIFEVTNISFGSSSGSDAELPQSQFQTQQSYSFSLQIKTHSY